MGSLFTSLGLNYPPVKLVVMFENSSIFYRPLCYFDCNDIIFSETEFHQGPTFMQKLLFSSNNGVKIGGANFDGIRDFFKKYEKDRTICNHLIHRSLDARFCTAGIMTPLILDSMPNYSAYLVSGNKKTEMTNISMLDRSFDVQHIYDEIIFIALYSLRFNTYFSHWPIYCKLLQDSGFYETSVKRWMEAFQIPAWVTFLLAWMVSNVISLKYYTPQAFKLPSHLLSSF